MIAGRVKPVAAACRHVHVHGSELVISPQQEDAVWEADFQRKQQRRHLNLLRPTVDKVAVEHVRHELDVSARAVAGEAVLAKKGQQIT